MKYLVQLQKFNLNIHAQKEEKKIDIYVEAEDSDNATSLARISAIHAGHRGFTHVASCNKIKG